MGATPSAAKSEHADQRQSREGQRDSDVADDSPGQEYLNERRQRIDREIDLGKEDCSHGTIGEVGVDDLRLLEIEKRGGDGVEQHVADDSEEVGRRKHCSDAVENATANRTIGFERSCRVAIRCRTRCRSHQLACGEHRQSKKGA